MNVVERLKRRLPVLPAIYNEGLVFETWGNISSRPAENQVVITPSGIHYEKLQYVDMVVVNMSGEIEEGRWKPSTELPSTWPFIEPGMMLKPSFTPTAFSCRLCGMPAGNSCSYRGVGPGGGRGGQSSRICSTGE